MRKSAQFLIIGTGDLEGVRDNLIKSSEKVRALGSLSDKENIAIYRKSHLLISPSCVENFHYVTAEARLCGIPAISSDISGPRSIIIDGTKGKLANVCKTDGFVSPAFLNG